jgi:hypothetical protein
MKNGMLDVKKEMLDKLIEHLSMMDDPLEKGEEDKEGEVEIMKIEAKPESEDLENGKEKSSEESSSEEDEKELLKKKFKKQMSDGY